MPTSYRKVSEGESVKWERVEILERFLGEQRGHVESRRHCKQQCVAAIDMMVLHKRQQKFQTKVRPRRKQALNNSQCLSRDIHFCKRLCRRNQRLSVTDLMALGKLRLDGNQNEGHDPSRQAGAMDSSPVYLEVYTHL
jgi:hypothetical protein